jgi:hypothetical protein
MAILIGAVFQVSAALGQAPPPALRDLGGVAPAIVSPIPRVTPPPEPEIVLKIIPIEKSTRPEVDALAARLYAMLPLPRIGSPISCRRWRMDAVHRLLHPSADG